MRETQYEVAALRQLMQDSIDKAGSFIRESLQMPSHSLSVEQLLRYWSRMRTAAVATTTARGEPRVAPTGVALFRGGFVIPTVAEAARTGAIRTRPAVSVAHFDEGDLAVIAHGKATIVGEGDALFDDLTALQRELSDGEDVTRWKGTGVYLCATPQTLYTFARYPERFPD